MLNTLLQSIALSVFSNILAQGITSYQENKPYGIDITPILQFVVYTIVNIPINVLWQEWLEATFPGSKPAPAPAAADEKKGSKAVDSDKQVRDVKNTLIKFAMDQSVGAGFNIPIFLATIAAVKGQGWEQIVETVRRDAWPIYLAGLKLWPAVSIVSFAAVPVERRVIFGSLAGVVWNTYLSLKAK